MREDSVWEIAQQAQGKGSVDVFRMYDHCPRSAIHVRDTPMRGFREDDRFEEVEVLASQPCCGGQKLPARTLWALLASLMNTLDEDFSMTFCAKHLEELKAGMVCGAWSCLSQFWI